MEGQQEYFEAKRRRKYRRIYKKGHERRFKKEVNYILRVCLFMPYIPMGKNIVNDKYLSFYMCKFFHITFK